MKKKKKYEDGGSLKIPGLGNYADAGGALLGLLNDDPTSRTNAKKGEAIGKTVGALTNLIPGVGPILGQVLTPLLGSLGSSIGGEKDTQNNLNYQYQNNTSTEGTNVLALGGALKDASSDFAKFSGNTHEQGGISINANGYPSDSNIEVENEEVIVKHRSLSGKEINFVFSKRLKI